MAELFDDISRIVGSAVPRRQALRLIIHAFAGGVAATLLPTRAGASLLLQQATCNTDFFQGGTGEATVGYCDQIQGADFFNARNNACSDARGKVRAEAGKKCPASCPSVQEISWICPHPNGSAPHCSSDNTVLIVNGGGTYRCICPSGVVCGGVCCSTGSTCCSGVCCPPNYSCVNGTCTCPASRVCNSGACCSSTQICCGGVACCASSYCTNGRCNIPSPIRG